MASEPEKKKKRQCVSNMVETVTWRMLDDETNVLLVGEGDFSFAKCYLEQCVQGRNIKVFATCFLSKLLPKDRYFYGCYYAFANNFQFQEVSSNLTDAQRKNIDEIKNMGGIVLTDVDATTLEKHSIINKYKFSKIIFNFPHVKKKSNIRDNRKLLELFLKSAGKILENKGSIYVTLCKGQGGTPMDQIKRNPADTWKIVDLAASAGLILTKLDIFNAASWEEYTCTDYRGQQKAFCIDGALTHEFMKEDIPVLSQEFSNITKRKSSCLICLFDERIQLIYERKITKIMDSPKVLLPTLIKSVTDFSSVQLISIQNLLICSCTFVSPTSCSIPLAKSYCSMHPFDCPKCLDLFSSVILHYRKFYEDFIVTGSMTCMNYFNFNVPFYYFMLLFKPQEYLLLNAVMEYLNLVFSPVDFKMHSNTNDRSICSLKFKNSFSGITCNNTLKITKVYVVFSSSEHQGSVFYDIVKISTNEVDIKDSEACSIGHIFQFDDLFAAALDMEAIAALKFHIVDKRVMFSDGLEVIQKLDKENVVRTVYGSLSVFPPVYRHDVSFWINNGFDEKTLFVVAWSVFGGTIKDISLIDTYYNVALKKTSKCFRFLYQSYDSAFSDFDCYMLHNALCSIIQKELKVEIRK